jgi:hypothetical protein
MSILARAGGIGLDGWYHGMHLSSGIREETTEESMSDHTEKELETLGDLKNNWGSPTGMNNCSPK